MPIFDPASYKPPTLVTVLAIDARYFHAARQTYLRAAKSTQVIERAEAGVARIEARIEEIERRDEHAAWKYYDELEPLAIQIEGAEYSLGAAYGPFLQNLATVHMLCAASLEAHINIQGESRLQNRVWEAFERLALDSKWLFLPRFLGKPGFETGTEPFQSFDVLIRTRNRLVHYKVRREQWRSPGVPAFLDDLGLSLKAAERSLGAVKRMISVLANQFGESAPTWLDSEYANFFELEAVEKPS